MRTLTKLLAAGDLRLPHGESGTRTARVRINSQQAGLLKPDMYRKSRVRFLLANIKVLAVPDSAVLDSGVRRLVLVELGEGRYESRTVTLGIRADGYVEVLGGLKAGERVVVSANFLIDAESNLKAALGGFGHHPSNGTTDKNGQAKPGAPALASHHGVGNIKQMDWAHAVVTIAHDPIPSLRWPAMTMVAPRDPGCALIEAGQKVDFEIIRVARVSSLYAFIRGLSSLTAIEGPLTMLGRIMMVTRKCSWCYLGPRL
jgi:Cu(I)/Ag(I) efflux system membrane fusion protein